jgi:hypothetical protein
MKFRIQNEGKDPNLRVSSRPSETSLASAPEHRFGYSLRAGTADSEQASIRDLENQITELAGHLNAGNHRFLTFIAEYDNRKGWSDGGTQSCAHWLNYRCGIALGAAREKVRVAHALESLPKISAAMAEGRLSYSKARALTRVACEGTEDYLLSIALNGTAEHVEKTVRGFRRAKEVEELSREARQQANKRVSYYFDNDGSLVVKARLPAETGALLIKALDGALEDLRGAETSADVPAGSAPGKAWRRRMVCRRR